VIIPAYQAQSTLPRVLAALQPQVTSAVEVLVIESSGAQEAAALQRTYPWVQVLGHSNRVLPGAARNIGARAALGSRLAFLDADSPPGPRWLTSLEGKLDTTCAAAVAGAVHNGTPNSSIGTTSYLLEFSEFLPERRGKPPHGATCNLLVARSAFEAAGGFCEDVWPGEDTILTVPWARSKRLEFAPDAGTWHLNRTRLDDLLAHQYRLGCSFVTVCDRSEVPYKHFSSWPLLAAAPLLRLGSLGLRLSGQADRLREVLRLSPVLSLSLAAWTAGVAAGRRAAR
jgi:glycosyltransferase involved in cell wall biosynthesis